jgi:hypothetical protein
MRGGLLKAAWVGVAGGFLTSLAYTGKFLVTNNPTDAIIATSTAVGAALAMVALDQWS